MNELAPKESGGEFLLYQTEDGQVRIDVRLQDETVWLTQQMIAELFRTTIPNISMHIRNIYAEGELTSEATIKKFLTVRQVSKQDAEEYAKTEYELFAIRRRAYKESIGEVETIKQLEEAAKELKKLEGPKDHSDKDGDK